MAHLAETADEERRYALYDDLFTEARLVVKNYKRHGSSRRAGGWKLAVRYIAAETRSEGDSGTCDFAGAAGDTGGFGNPRLRRIDG